MAIWLNEEDVRALVSMRDLIDAMEQALRAFSQGRARQPVRTVIEAGAHAFFGSMPAHLEAGLGAKLVTVFEANAARGLPTHQAVIVLFDSETGALLAVLDGRYITEARTAAVSAVAVRRLARKDARRLAILGSGVQAGSHLEALRLVRDFSDTRCWSPTPEHLAAFVSRHAEVRAAAGAEEAVRDADVVVLVTSSPTPAVRNQWIADGACVISVGACRPNQREMDPELVARGKLYVDSRAAALLESGDVVMGIAEGRFSADHIVAELGAAPGRRSEEEVTIFKSLGLAVEDVATARLAYERAHASGRGVLIN
jgi:alanine dehydrogenase